MSVVKAFEDWDIAERSLRCDIVNAPSSSEALEVSQNLDAALISKWCEQNKYDECELGRLVKDHYEAILESVVDELV